MSGCGSLQAQFAKAATASSYEVCLLGGWVWRGFGGVWGGKWVSDDERDDERDEMR